ncbi:DNA cytosine methyltransferase [Spirosoma sp. RP8]|uniref:DNA (cytosine-5-)-methyltransferase n=1 Tax=Spirosoma liriopis TaxID=2937440 RepID=A0ABT0HNN0_9BACT|nr:DNA cytosine methyltransferase [Spirosoma liriopis]MCK8493781.1 DNA cytosine methyltransferase [Spirosoma liriopis]
MKYLAADLFAGCGGLTEGMHEAGFETVLAFELEPVAVQTYRMNHPGTEVIEGDIRNVDLESIKKKLNGQTLHLLAGCPPCQGFSSVRRLNRKQAVDDKRNSLILEFLRFVKELRPYTIMMENVPGLKEYDQFKKVVSELTSDELGYQVDVRVVNVKDYGVAQSRKRLVLLGSRLKQSTPILVAGPTGERRTVRHEIEHLPSPDETDDELHKMVSTHTDAVMKRIQLTPKNGGSWKDLPSEYVLNCHSKPNVGFNDIYGRLRWDDYSSTITGGCLNPSKGRFLHPVQDRAITPREAALLQSFPDNYRFPVSIKKADLALMIGNALPPRFSKVQCNHLKNHLDTYLEPSDI